MFSRVAQGEVVGPPKWRAVQGLWSGLSCRTSLPLMLLSRFCRYYVQDSITKMSDCFSFRSRCPELAYLLPWPFCQARAEQEKFFREAEEAKKKAPAYYDMVPLWHLHSICIITYSLHCSSCFGVTKVYSIGSSP